MSSEGVSSPGIPYTGRSRSDRASRRGVRSPHETTFDRSAEAGPRRAGWPSGPARSAPPAGRDPAASRTGPASFRGDLVDRLVDLVDGGAVPEQLVEWERRPVPGLGRCRSGRAPGRARVVGEASRSGVRSHARSFLGVGARWQWRGSKCRGRGTDFTARIRAPAAIALRVSQQTGRIRISKAVAPMLEPPRLDRRGDGPAASCPPARMATDLRHPNPLHRVLRLGSAAGRDEPRVGTDPGRGAGRSRVGTDSRRSRPPDPVY